MQMLLDASCVQHCSRKQQGTTAVTVSFYHDKPSKHTQDAHMQLLPESRFYVHRVCNAADSADHTLSPMPLAMVIDSWPVRPSRMVC